MATAYGNVVQHWQAYCDAFIVSQTATTATIRCNCYFHSIAWGYDVGATGTATANGQSASAHKTASSGTGQTVNQLFATKDVTVSKNSSGFNVYCKATMQVTGGYHNGTSTAGVNVWVPAITYSAPPKPSNLKVERVSDTQQKLSWTNATGGTTNPVTGVNLYRHTDGGDTETLYSGSVINSYTDGSTAAGHMYDYDVRDTGPGGLSDMSDSVRMYTSPLAPGAIGVAKTDAGVLLTPSTMPAYYDAVEMGRSTDSGKTWETVDYTESGGGYLDPRPPAGAVRYRLRGSIEGMSGAWAETEEVVTICPPNAPTLGPLANVYATGSSVYVSWTPNHPDWTEQNAAQVEVTKDGTATVYDVAGSTSSYTIAKAQNGGYTVRVRTKGQDPDWGAWSAYAAFTVATAPTVAISAPTASTAVDTLPYAAEWSVTAPAGIVEQTAVISDESGTEMKTVSLDPSARSMRLEATMGFANKSSYTLAVSVRGGEGLSAQSSVTFSTDWKHPDAPAVDIAQTDDMAASISIAAKDTAPKATSFDIVRVLDDGSRLVMATGVKDGDILLDRLPPLNADYSYEVTAYADTGALTTVSYPAHIDSGGMEVFNFGTDASSAVALGLSANDTESIDPTGTAFHFALGKGNLPLPTFYPDGDMDVTGQHQYSIYREEKYLALRRLVRDPSNAVCWFRGAYGRRARCVAKWALGYSAASYDLFSVSADLTEVVWEEPE